MWNVGALYCIFASRSLLWISVERRGEAQMEVYTKRWVGLNRSRGDEEEEMGW